ncbi:MAG: hypothetical protein JWN27_3094 [Candidatus Eremiobacteraeota bacterium]|nr:hypothetical protein [Candidatus Eremiobacteraeota bacterium]
MKLLKIPSIPHVAAYAAAAALAIVLHAFAGLRIVAHVASVPLLTDVKHVRLRLFAAYAVLGLVHQIDEIAKPHLADVGTLFSALRR